MSGSSPSSRRSRRSSRPSTGQTTTPVLSAEYLNKHSSKQDLVKRMRNVVEHLSDEAVEPDSPDYPGLAGLAATLVEDRYLKHKDKDVRLHTVLACVEVFYVYAPEPPFDEQEILKIFPQIIQQVANLATCTSPTQSNYASYHRLLTQLSEVKLGVVLVEMTKTLDSYSQTSSQEHDHDGPSSEDALECLREFVEVLLHCVHIDHSVEIRVHAADAISACVEEFEGGVPIPIMDELLKCIGTGSVIDVTNPEFVKVSAKIANAKRKKDKKGASIKLPSRYISQTNPSYLVAKKVISTTIDKISTPIANLLNGLLDGNPNVIKDSDIECDPPIEKTLQKGNVVDALGNREEDQDESARDTADVWTIVYELHKVEPSILTTVIGTIAAGLTHSDTNKRLRVTRLLGRLFYSRSSNIGLDFHACFLQWVRRHKDPEVSIREVMVRYLLDILRNKSSSSKLCEEATNALVNMTESDPSVEVRLQCIAGICELLFHDDSDYSTISSKQPFASKKLIKAVGDRIQSKHKKERMDSITGLVKIYHRHYITRKLKDVELGGDDCDIGVILDIINDSCDMTPYISQPKKHPRGKKNKKHSLSSNTFDNISDDIDSKYGFIPSLLFKCASHKTDQPLKNRILTLMDDVLFGAETIIRDSKGKKSVQKDLSPTSRAVGLTMIINSMQNSSDVIEGRGENIALSWLRCILSERAFLQKQIRAYIDAKAKADSISKDSEEKTHANSFALTQLEKMAKLTVPPSGEDLKSVLLKIHNAKDKHIFRLLASISSPSHSSEARMRIFEDLPRRTKSLGTPTAQWLFTLSKRAAMGYFLNSEIIETCILLSQESFNEGDFEVSRAFLETAKFALQIFPNLTDRGFDFATELFNKCEEATGTEKKQITKFGIMTVVSTLMSSTAHARKSLSPSKISGGESSSGSSSKISADDDVIENLLSLCMKDESFDQASNAISTLTSICDADQDKNEEVFGKLLEHLTSSSRLSLYASEKPNHKIVNTLKKLTLIVQNVPSLFLLETKKKNRAAKVVKFTLQTILLGKEGRLSSGSTNSSPDESRDESPGKGNSKKKRATIRKSDTAETFSLPCMRICGAIEFLVAHALQLSKLKQQPSRDHMECIFQVLNDILESHGLPSSPRDRSDITSDIDHAKLRTCASIALIQLCNGNMKFYDSFFHKNLWHLLGNSFLDEDYSVRDAVMGELCCFLTGQGIYGGKLPHLGFLAYISFCPELDTLNHTNSVGKTIKDAALKSTTKLRKTCESFFLRCRAHSRKSEQQFERTHKVKMMPEYSIPYALYFLVFRPETPDGSQSKPEEEKMLRKRLTCLFDPLVKSVGDTAENISFMLRMIELISRSYSPKIPDEGQVSFESDILQAKLSYVCSIARNVLLSYVKRDSDLTPYPGRIIIPLFLFELQGRISMSPSNEEGNKRTATDLENLELSPIHANAYSPSSSGIESSQSRSGNVVKEGLMSPLSTGSANTELNSPQKRKKVAPSNGKKGEESFDFDEEFEDDEPKLENKKVLDKGRKRKARHSKASTPGSSSSRSTGSPDPNSVTPKLASPSSEKERPSSRAGRRSKRLSSRR